MTHKPPTIIALTGSAGAGKDTVASIILAASPQTRAIAFADALRHEVAQAWGIDHRVLTERATKEQLTSALCIEKCGECGFQLWFSNPWPARQQAQVSARRELSAAALCRHQHGAGTRYTWTAADQLVCLPESALKQAPAQASTAQAAIN